MPVTLNKTDATQELVTVQDQTTDTTTLTHIALIGPGETSYGKPIQENIVSLVENFAHGTAPAASLEGQLWYDKNTNERKLKLKKNTSSWIEIIDANNVNDHIDSRISGGTGVTYSNGSVSIGQDVRTTSDVTFGNVTSAGTNKKFTGDGSGLNSLNASNLSTGTANRARLGSSSGADRILVTESGNTPVWKTKSEFRTFLGLGSAATGSAETGSSIVTKLNGLTGSSRWNLDEGRLDSAFNGKLVSANSSGDLTAVTYGNAISRNTGTSSGNVPVLNSSGDLADSVIPNLHARKITSGTFSPARLAGAAANNRFLVAQGSTSMAWETPANARVSLELGSFARKNSLVANDIPSLSASKITSSEFNRLRLGTGAGNNRVLITQTSTIPVWVATLPDANIPNLNASKINDGTFDAARLGDSTGNNRILTTNNSGTPTWIASPINRQLIEVTASNSPRVPTIRTYNVNYQQEGYTFVCDTEDETFIIRMPSRIGGNIRIGWKCTVHKIHDNNMLLINTSDNSSIVAGISSNKAFELLYENEWIEIEYGGTNIWHVRPYLDWSKRNNRQDSLENLFVPRNLETIQSNLLFTVHWPNSTVNSNYMEIGNSGDVNKLQENEFYYIEFYDNVHEYVSEIIPYSILNQSGVSSTAGTNGTNSNGISITGPGDQDIFLSKTSSKFLIDSNENYQHSRFSIYKLPIEVYQESRIISFAASAANAYQDTGHDVPDSSANYDFDFYLVMFTTSTPGDYVAEFIWKGGFSNMKLQNLSTSYIPGNNDHTIIGPGNQTIHFARNSSGNLLIGTENTAGTLEIYKTHLKHGKTIISHDFSSASPNYRRVGNHDYPVLNENLFYHIVFDTTLWNDNYVSDIIKGKVLINTFTNNVGQSGRNSNGVLVRGVGEGLDLYISKTSSNELIIDCNLAGTFYIYEVEYDQITQELKKLGVSFS